MKRGFLIDMDGVIYRSAQLVPGALDFIQMLHDWRIPFLFLTNNSQRTRRDVATRPGCGAIVSLIEAATGVKAFSVGKPSPVMMRTARKELGMATSETIMVGDTMETDILGGVQMGYRTVLVLTGTTKRQDLVHYAYQPDLIVESVAELCDPDRLRHEILPTMNREDDTPLDMREWIKAHS